MNDPNSITLTIPNDTHDGQASAAAAPGSTPASASAAAAAATTPKRYRSTPAKTFQCTGFGDCKMVFSRSEHLARHIRKHTGERPFACHCTKQFSRLDNLRQHAQTVHADKPDQNEKMMKELTSLHSSMSAATGGPNKRPSKRATRAPPELAPAGQAYPSQRTAPPPQGYDQQSNDGYPHPIAYPGLPHGAPVYMTPDGQYAHPNDPYGQYGNYPLSEAAFPGNYPPQGQPPNHGQTSAPSAGGQQQGQGPPQLHVQPTSYPTHPVYEYSRRSGSDGESPVDNNPPLSARESIPPSHSPATPTSATVPSSANSLNAPHPTYPHHHSHYTPNGVMAPYPSRSPIPTPSPQSFRPPLRGVRDGAAGGEYYQPFPISSQHAYYAHGQQHHHQHHPQHQQHHQQRPQPPPPLPPPPPLSPAVSSSANPNATAAPLAGTAGGIGNSISVDPHSFQIKHEEYPIPPLIKSEQFDGSRPPSTAPTAAEQYASSARDGNVGQSDDGGGSNGSGRIGASRYRKGGNDSAAGVNAGGFGGEQRFPGEFNHLQYHHAQQSHYQQQLRGGEYLAVQDHHHPNARNAHNANGLHHHLHVGIPHATSLDGPEERYDAQFVPLSPLESDEAVDRPGTAPASFTHNGQLHTRSAASASSGSPITAQSSRVFTDAMASAAAAGSKYYSSIGGLRDGEQYADPASSSSFAHRSGSNSPPFRFGVPSPRQQSGAEMEHQSQFQQYGQHYLHQQQSPIPPLIRGAGTSAVSAAAGTTSSASTAASRPGNVLRPLPGWTTAPASTLAFQHSSSNNDSPFSYNAPALDYPVSASTTDYKASLVGRKRTYPASSDDDDHNNIIEPARPRTSSSRPGTRSGRIGWDANDFAEPPRPTSRRLSVMELCNTRTGGTGLSTDDRPRTSSGRFSSSTSGPNANAGISSSFSFPSSTSSHSNLVGNQYSNSLRPSSSSGLVGSLRPTSSSGNVNGPSALSTGSRPSSSAGRGLEQYAIVSTGGSSRPGTAGGGIGSSSWGANSASVISSGITNEDVFGGRKASTGIVLPPLNISPSASPSSSSAASASTNPTGQSASAVAYGRDYDQQQQQSHGSYGEHGRRSDGTGRNGMEWDAPPGQGRIAAAQ